MQGSQPLDAPVEESEPVNFFQQGKKRWAVMQQDQNQSELWNVEALKQELD